MSDTPFTDAHTFTINSEETGFKDSVRVPADIARQLERELAECRRDAKHWQALHLKTGRIYTVVGEAIDATNATQGRVMVIYERDGRRFVRDAYEFQEKFAAIDAAREKT